MKRKIVFFIISIIVLLPIASYGTGYANSEDYADKLKLLGVFVGTPTGFELERKPTRLEGVAMLIRLLGAEDEAIAMKGADMPFKDVPYWGSGYVAYAYKNKLTYGIDDTNFGSDSSIDANAYLTFLLRSLGYNDVEGDFNFSNALQYSKEIGLLDTTLYNNLLGSPFLRAHVAVTSYDALNFNVKEENVRLLDKLMGQGKISVPRFGAIAKCDALFESEDSSFYSVSDFEKEDYLKYIEYLSFFGYQYTYSFSSEVGNDTVYIYENDNLQKSIMLSLTEISGTPGLLIIINY